MDDSRTGRTPFGERLLYARKQKRLTQKQVESRIGIGQSTLAQLELNGTGSAYTVALALLYGVSPFWLALNKGQPYGGLPMPEWLYPLSDEDMVRVQKYAEALADARKEGRSPPPMPDNGVPG
ncbi:helix-turn-helix domain-containing protein [Burkholderia ubonensis]|uniref:helix-turn-helix domain-containing protein n=2 Tax=Burkholderia TaxID=32008 RepID=UPI0009B3059F|nr:helix-turn-helix transcriptional regulator [Burkholderia ubonensis]